MSSRTARRSGSKGHSAGSRSAGTAGTAGTLGSPSDLPEGCKEILSYYQTDVVKRIALDCRKKFGTLLFHRMGSGKTIVAYSLLANFPTEPKRLILVPESIMDNFQAELPNGNINAGCDVFTFFHNKPPKIPDGTSSAETQRILKGFYFSDAAAGIRDMQASFDIVNYNTIKRIMNSDDTEAALNALFKGRILIADEAHNLLEFIKTHPKSALMQRAIWRCARIVLMTGTPIMSEASDVSALLRLVAGPSSEDVFPLDDTTFTRLYYNQNTSTELTNSVLYFLSNQLQHVTSAVSGAGPLLKVAAAVAAEAAKAESEGRPFNALSFAAYYVAANIGSAALKEIIVRAMEQKIISGEGIYSLKTEQFINQAINHVSFFDYEFSVPRAPGAPRPSLQFPVRSAFDVDVPYTKDQTNLLLRMLSRDADLTDIPGTLSGELKARSKDRTIVRRRSDRGVLGMKASDKMEDPAVYTYFGGQVGNISEDSYELLDRIEEREFSMGVTDPISGATQTIGWYQYHVPGLSKGHIPFKCPKFDKALELLLQIAKTMHASGAAQIYNAKGPMPDDPKNSRFLPLVYSNYEELGFKQFSAYLTHSGYRHIVYFKSATAPVSRTTLNMLAMQKSYPLVRREADLADAPLCAIIHPTIKEGISFTHAPAMVVLERIIGNGIQEQVYGRILRRYDAPLTSQEERPVKRIFQLAGTNGKVRTVDIEETGTVKKSSSFWDSVSAWRNYYSSTLEQYVIRKNILVRGAAYQDKRYFQHSMVPEGVTATENTKQEALLAALATALTKTDDKKLGQQCRARSLMSDPRCSLCLNGSCKACTDKNACGRAEALEATLEGGRSKRRVTMGRRSTRSKRRPASAAKRVRSAAKRSRRSGRRSGRKLRSKRT